MIHLALFIAWKIELHMDKEGMPAHYCMYYGISYQLSFLIILNYVKIFISKIYI